MGFAVAAEAARRGCETILVAGPVALKTPKGVKRIDVVSAREMYAAVKSVAKGASTVLVATAAVADWRPKKCAALKLKKKEMSGTLQLARNPDIIKSVKGVRKIGFAAETGAAESEAARKCREKKLEFVVANDVTEKGAGFGCDTNHVKFVFADGRIKEFPLMSKRLVARRIVDEVLRP
jgi:phosphopantothenoylcysteine decarboxylase/phosphopantothenate--cysteine ligase